MRKFVISSALLFSLFAGADAQQPSGSPPAQPPPSSTPVPQPQTLPQQRPIPVRSGTLRPLQNFPLNPVSESDRLSARVVRLQWLTAPLYKKPGSKETAALAPDRSLVQRYASLLKDDDTGLITLAPDRGCVHSERVVSVKDECLKYSFPGAGNSYSFRTDSYRLRHLADLTFTDGRLRITGIFMHGLSVDLGDVPIEGVSLNTPGMNGLTAFTPSTTAADVAQIDNLIMRGVKIGSYTYSKELVPVVDRTYALRAVAYRGKVARTIGGIRYNELDYDKRRDVIVAFRVVKIDNNGVTIVWRKLSESESPRIRMPRQEGPDEGEAN